MVSLKKLARSSVASGVIASILVLVTLFAIRSIGMLEPLELLAYDWYVRLRPPLRSASHVVLIGVTEQDIQDQGRWPLSDDVLAELLSTLSQYQPRAIGLDIYRDVKVPPGYDKLAAEFQRQPRIIAVRAMGLGGQKGVGPPPVLKGTEQVGFSDIVIDPDGIVRRGVLMMDDDEGDDPAVSFALRLALLFLQEEEIYLLPPRQNPLWMRLGPTELRRFASNDGSYIGAHTGGYQILLDFRDSEDAVPVFSIADLLAAKIDPSMIRDAIVIFGTTAESVKDSFYTPRSRGLKPQDKISGIALHAHIVNQLLRAAHGEAASVITVSDTVEWVWIALWSGLGIGLGGWVRSPWRLSLWAAVGLCLLGGLVWLAFNRGVWLPVVPPALAWGLSIAAITAAISSQEKRQRTFLMEQFSLYVAREVAEEIWQQRDDLLHDGRLRPEEMEVSVLFTDLVGFTTVSEKLKENPQQLVDWLNEYMQAMTPHVVDNGGVILRFIGDAIMAVFGVPLKRTTQDERRQDAVNAVTCALGMEQTLIKLNKRWPDKQLPTIGMRVGIFTGKVVAGSIGGLQRLEYNVHGDTVNTAARLESYEKASFVPNFDVHPCRVLIGATTQQYLQGKFQTNRLGEVPLKGKEEMVAVYEVIGK